MLAGKLSSAPTSLNDLNSNYRRMSLPNSRASVPYFVSREEAGETLAKLLNDYTNNPDTVVLSIKPTATALAYEIAKVLELPLDLFLIRSFKYDGMTIGAITDRSDQPLLKEQIIRGCNVPKETVDELIAKERVILESLKHECSPLNLDLPCSEDATLILCTDGIQTGQDARNTIAILKKILNYRGKIVLVGGIMGSDAQRMFMREADDVISVRCPQIVGSVASWYENATELTYEEVRQILSKAARESYN